MNVPAWIIFFGFFYVISELVDSVWKLTMGKWSTTMEFNSASTKFIGEMIWAHMEKEKELYETDYFRKISGTKKQRSCTIDWTKMAFTRLHSGWSIQRRRNPKCNKGTSGWEGDNTIWSYRGHAQFLQLSDRSSRKIKWGEYYPHPQRWDANQKLRFQADQFVTLFCKADHQKSSNPLISKNGWPHFQLPKRLH